MDTVPPDQSVADPDNLSTAPKWDERTTLFVGVGFTILLVVLGVMFWPVIPLALSTSVIAYLLDPITDFFDKRVSFGRRGISILLTFLFIIVIVLLVFVMILPPLIQQSVDSVVSLVNYGRELVTEPYEPFQRFIAPDSEEPIALSTYITNLLDEQGFEASSEWLIEQGSNLNLDRQTIVQIVNVSGNVTGNIVGSVFSIAGSTLGLIFNSLLFVSILAIMLGGADQIPKAIFKAAPDGYQDDAERLLRDLAGVWDAYVRGNFYLGLIMGFAMWVMAIVLGLPNPLFLAFIAFSMEFIPNIGPTISNLAAVALALVGGSSTFPGMNPIVLAGIVFVLWIILQQIEAIVLVPRIVGDSLQLHPAVVVLAVIWGGSFAGILGIIIAPPLVASFRIILQYIYGRLTGRAAFVDHPDSDDNLGNRLQAFMRWFSERGKRKKMAPEPEMEGVEDDIPPETA